jgi:hypothetical protein
VSSLPPTVQPSPDTDVTFKYFWDFGEHVRLVRAVMRHQGGRGRWIYRLLVAAMALVMVLALLGSEGHWGATIRELAPWMVLFGLWMAVFRWGLPFYSAWGYRRTNPCVHHEMTRAVTPGGIQLRCHTTATDIRWEGVLRAVETPEFFLFYVSRNCAVQVPKRAIPNSGDLTRVRSLVQHALGSKAHLSSPQVKGPGLAA